MLSIKNDAPWKDYSQSALAFANANIVANYSNEGKEKGNGREAYALRILSHLDANVELTPTGSESDCRAKWDITIQSDDRVYPMQIKSSEFGRIDFEEKSPRLGDISIPHCPCIVLEDRLDRAFLGYNILVKTIELLDLNGVTVILKADAQAAIQQYKRLKTGGTKALPKSVWKAVFPGSMMQILKDLGMGGEVKGSFHLF
jgi:hypothetical protein